MHMRPVGYQGCHHNFCEMIKGLLFFSCAVISILIFFPFTVPSQERRLSDKESDCWAS